MSITAGKTADEIREFVEQYYEQPYGTRLKWLEMQGVSDHRLRRWRSAVFSGDLERGLIPRREDGMSNPRRRLLHEKDARDAAATEAARQQELGLLRARIAELEGTNDALGKAIGLLHALNEHEPDANRTTNDRSDS